MPNELGSNKFMNCSKGLISILMSSGLFSKAENLVMCSKLFVCSIFNFFLSKAVFFNFISISFYILSSYNFLMIR